MAPNETIKNLIDDDEQMDWELPQKQGLYDPQNEHEACGVGFIVAIDGKRSHKVGLFIFDENLF
jgi:hypothetical protein